MYAHSVKIHAVRVEIMELYLHFPIPFYGVMLD
jgi:hypothetical protein